NSINRLILKTTPPCLSRLLTPLRRIPVAFAQIMKPNQIHVIATAVFSNLQQIIHGVKARFLGKIVCDIRNGNLINRIDDDVAFFHWVTTADLNFGTLPDANTAFDSAEPDTHAELFSEHHTQPNLIATDRYLQGILPSLNNLSTQPKTTREKIPSPSNRTT